MKYTPRTIFCISDERKLLQTKDAEQVCLVEHSIFAEHNLKMLSLRSQAFDYLINGWSGNISNFNQCEINNQIRKMIRLGAYLALPIDVL